MAARMCFVVGTRPNAVEAAPVLRGLQALEPALEILLVHTGQHYDRQLAGFLGGFEAAVGAAG